MIIVVKIALLEFWNLRKFSAVLKEAIKLYVKESLLFERIERGKILQRRFNVALSVQKKIFCVCLVILLVHYRLFRNLCFDSSISY